MRTINYSWYVSWKIKWTRQLAISRDSYSWGKLFWLRWICAGEFEIDQRELDFILAIPENLSILIHTSTIIDEGKNYVSKELGTLALILHMNWKRVLCRACPAMIEQIAKTTSLPLIMLFKRCGRTYKPSIKWKNLSERACYWLVSQTILRVMRAVYLFSIIFSRRSYW